MPSCTAPIFRSAPLPRPLATAARASVANGRGNGALRKLGAVQEGILRRSFLRDGRYHDQVLWSVLAEDWRLQRTGQSPALVH